MAKRSYGTGRLYVVVDRAGRGSWTGSWWSAARASIASWASSAHYSGYLRRHLAPFFGDRPMDRIDAARVEAHLHAKRRDVLSPKTVQNHRHVLHGIYAFAIRRA